MAGSTSNRLIQPRGGSQRRGQAPDLRQPSLRKIMKKIRLSKDIYLQNNQPCLITICAYRRKHLFENKLFSDYCAGLFIELCKKHDFKIYVYCFMPEHVHFVISVQGNKSIIDLIMIFKSISTRQSRLYGFKDKIFQARFYDHFIREEEGLNQAIDYLLNNPVRKNIVSEWREYPYSKCFVGIDDLYS